MSEASLPFVLLPEYLKILAPTRAVTFKIRLWGIIPGAGWAECLPFPGRNPLHVPSHPCSQGMEQQWGGPCAAQGDRAVSITGQVGATSLHHHSLACAVSITSLLHSLEHSIYAVLSPIVLRILKSILATLRTLFKNCGYNLLKLSGLVT